AGRVSLRANRVALRKRLPPPAAFEIGRCLLLRDGGDAGLIGTGLGSQWALEAAELLAGRGIHAAVLHVPTLKPLDSEAIASFAARFPAVTTVENHSVIGALGSGVCADVGGGGLSL